jgi:NAD+ synthase (glutamine-hydrolysing)
MDLLEMPRTSIIALTMPGAGTTDRTKSNALELMEALGVTWETIPIGEHYEPFLVSVHHPLLPDGSGFVEDFVFENVQARVRKLMEFTMANERKGIVLGTGDLSESALGWCTFSGDHLSNYNPNLGVAKTLMTYLIEWAIDGVFGKEPKVQEVLRDIIATPISPELKSPGAGGEITQKTEVELGPYELYDFIMYYFVRFGFSPVRIARMAMHAFGDQPGRDLATIKKFMKKFIQRFFINQFKRSCLPDGVKVGLTSLSPRGDWRMPSDASSNAWLEEIKNIPD